MNQRAIIQIILAVIGIPVLITVGIWTATDPMYAGGAVVLVVGTAVIIQLGRRIWLLIPFFAAFTGPVNFLPGGFAPRDLVVGVVAVVLPSLWVMKRFPLRVRFGMIEFALFLVLMMLGQAFLRNPTGLAVIGSDSVGGRPYFEIAVSVVAFVILSTQLVSLKNVRLMVLASFAGYMIIACLDTLMVLIPPLALYAAPFYLTASARGAYASYSETYVAVDQVQDAGRIRFLRAFSIPIMTLVLAFRHPLQLLQPRNIGFLLLASFAGICMLLSGFRSGIAYLGLLGIAAMLLNRKPLHIVMTLILSITLLSTLLVLQGSAFSLPLPAKRALSFLPGAWDSRVTSDAEGSSEWRWEMWETALTSEHYIRNKWVGDGYGFTAEELAYQGSLGEGGTAANTLQEYFLMTGTYHSGPVEAIKRIGYIGLFILFVVMCIFVKEAIAMVNRTRGTPYFPYAMFVALPLVVHPVMFFLIYGAFKGGLITLLIGGGGLRLIGNSLEEWKRQQALQGESGSGGEKTTGENRRRLIGVPASQ